MDTTQTLNSEEQEAILCICLIAAFADGAQSDHERSQIQKIAAGFNGANLDLTAATQEVLSGRLPLANATKKLQSQNSKVLAYEMAICVCGADEAPNANERDFLGRLRQELQLEEKSASTFQQEAQNIANESIPLPPVITGVPAPVQPSEIDSMILNSATISGALEIMPHSLATMAIVPLQMRLVYKIGKSYGYELDRTHIKDFLATVGVGLTSQVVEGLVGKFVGGVARHVGGRFIGMLAGQAASSGVAFATTYALGQVAKTYYSSGRTLTTDQLRSVFSNMLNEGRNAQGRYSDQIFQKSRQMSATEILPLLRQS